MIRADTCRAPGDAIDYAYGTADVRWSFSAELRDTGTVSLAYMDTDGGRSGDAELI